MLTRQGCFRNPRLWEKQILSQWIEGLQADAGNGETFILIGNKSGLKPCMPIRVLGEIGHFQACRQGSPMVAKGFQGPRGTPGMGEMSYNQIDHI